MSAIDAAVTRFARAHDVPPEVVVRELAGELTLAAQAAELAAVPAADRDALERTDTPVAPLGSGPVLPWLHGEMAWQRMRATALSVGAAAARLGLTGSALRRVLGTTTGAEVELLGAKDSRASWRVFAYQLPDEDGQGGEPAGQVGRRVQRNLPPGMHPAAVAAWWDAPNAALYLDGAELSPRTWVGRGLDPDRVIAAARSEDAG